MSWLANILSCDEAIDLCPVFQLSVKAEDNGIPRFSAVARIDIQLDRNLNSPVFEKEAYTANITANAERGQVLVTVSATDLDQVCQGQCRERSSAGHCQCHRSGSGLAGRNFTLIQFAKLN